MVQTIIFLSAENNSRLEDLKKKLEISKTDLLMKIVDDWLDQNYNILINSTTIPKEEVNASEVK